MITKKLYLSLSQALAAVVLVCILLVSPVVAQAETGAARSEAASGSADGAEVNPTNRKSKDQQVRIREGTSIERTGYSKLKTRWGHSESADPSQSPH